MFYFNDFDPKMFRFLRILICLFLVLCILVNCSPLRARATSVALPVVGASVAVSAPVVIGAVVIACGLYLASDAGSAAFNNLVSSISDGLDSAYTYVSEAGEKFIKCLSIDDHYYIPSSLASDVLSSVQSSDLVSSSLASDSIPDISYNGLSLSSAFSEIYRRALYLGRDYYVVTHSNNSSFSYFFYLSSSPIAESSDYYSPSSGERFVSCFIRPDLSFFEGTSSLVYKAADVISFGSFPKSYSPSVSGLSADIGQNLDDEKYKTWVQDPVISIN